MAKRLFSVVWEVRHNHLSASLRRGILLGSGPAVERVRSHTVPDTTKSPKWVTEEAERGHVETMQGR